MARGMTTHDRAMGTVEEEQWRAISSIEKTQERITTLLDGIAQRMETFEGRISDATRTPWAAVGITVTIMAFVLGGFGTVIGYAYISNLDDQANRLANVSNKFDAHISNGHPTSVIARIDANKEAIEGQIISNRRDTDALIEQFQAREKEVNERLRYLERRTGTLFKGGEPY